MISAYAADFHVSGGFPIDYVLIYGLFFSGLLALVYFPTHLTLLGLAARLRDRYTPVPAFDAEGAWAEEWKSSRAARRCAVDEDRGERVVQDGCRDPHAAHRQPDRAAAERPRLTRSGAWSILAPQ